MEEYVDEHHRDGMAGEEVEHSQPVSVLVVACRPVVQRRHPHRVLGLTERSTDAREALLPSSAG